MKLLKMFAPTYASTLVYMLQSTEYEIKPYLAWVWRTTDFSKVATRRSLDKTRRAKLLLSLVRFGLGMQDILGLALLLYAISRQEVVVGLAGLLIVVSAPLLWAHLIVLPLLLARHLIVKPKQRALVSRSSTIFDQTPAKKIAVAGSYGKTTMKEFLTTVLSEGKKVAATPGNKNVAVSHAAFATKLEGDEEVLIIEYGEGKPGDVAKFAAVTKPDIGIITGLAPAHLDQYKTLEAAGKDIFALASFLDDKEVYVNADSHELMSFIRAAHHTYTSKGVQGWRINDVVVSLDGTSFTMKKGKRTLHLKSPVLGAHLVGPLAVCVVIAQELGLRDEEIVAGVAKTKPYEHRMQPYQLAGGWVIDDTYNGNLEGVRAGLSLLASLPATRKTYITPGLVDQGEESERVHKEIGKLIADCNPDRVVLMKNSVTHWIQYGLDDAGYSGETTIVTDPLNFYTNLDHHIIGGEVMLMQNDWTDNYN